MFEILISSFAFILAIGILVTFHEFGHFYVARRLGVKVLRFSVGFGPVLWSRRAADGVEYTLCAIPLGGYVRMLGEDDEAVPEADIPYALNRQSLGKRMAIVIAGPAFNFLLAWVFIAIVSLLGISGMAPIIGHVDSDSVAQKAGLHTYDEIIAVDGAKTPTIQAVQHELVKFLDEGSVPLTVLHEGKERVLTLTVPEGMLKGDKDLSERFGFEIRLPARIGTVDPSKAAMRAGLQPGDLILTISGVPVKDWSDLVKTITASPGKELSLTVMRHHKIIDITVVPDEKMDGRGAIGITLPKDLIRSYQLGFMQSLVHASVQTFQYSLLTLKMMYYVVTSQASLDNISGPLTIAQVAGASIQVGFTYFLDFLALVSISLGVINLLPIPILDGGHLFFYLIEWARGKPLSAPVQNIGFHIGLIILISLMLLAFYNDIVRLTVS